MQERHYQQTAVDSIKLNQVNLCVLPMRAGKSYLIKLIIDKYQFKKVLIVVGYRKIVQQLASYFPSHTHILSGLPFDHTKQVHLASFQTIANRDIDLSEYDLIVQDEYHSRTSTAASNIVFQPNCTVILLTGTPLQNNNKLLTKGIDNFIQPITIKEMIENNWLAPTRFMSNSTILGDYADQLSTNKQDFDESIVRQIIQKEHLLNNIVTLIDDNHLATQHKCIVYVNYIATADELYELLKDRPNVFVVHSKLTQSQQDTAISAYQSATSGVLINVRALSLGFDSPSTDTIIYALFTKIHSLCLQILWRASTIDPANPSKVATVYDMTGQLAHVNPYTDFKSYSSKLSCKDQCIKQYPNDPLAQYFCMEACKSNPILVPCRGQLPISLAEHPFIYNYQIHSGKPCNESRPMWEYEYKQTNPSTGILTKWTKCKCGCVTSYDVRTLAEPSDMIQVYSDAKPTNTVTVLLSVEQHKALALFDDLSSKLYHIGMYDSSDAIYEAATQYFQSKPFQIMSNVQLKLPNVQVNPNLDQVMPLIDWFSDNQGFIKKLIKAKLTSMVSDFAMKPGYTWYVLNAVNESNQKSVLQFLKSDPDRSKFIKYFKKLQGV